MKPDIKVKTSPKCSCQIVADELYKAEAQIVPRPAEFNVSRGARDPRRARFMQEYGDVHGKFHKEVRKQLIDEIIKKHKMIKKPTDEEKLKRRKRYEDKQREIRRKRRIRKVVSTKVKRKKLPQVSACPECGDFHFKKSDQCKVRELKVKMIVQQIMKHSENIKVELTKGCDYVNELFRKTWTWFGKI